MPQIALPDEISFLEIRPELCVVAYRNVKVDAVDHPDLVESFRSNHARGKAARRDEIQHPELHRAISCWTDPEINRQLARMHPLGDYIAEIVLIFGRGFRYMDPALDHNPKHRRVLGDPVEFVRATTRVFRV